MPPPPTVAALAGGLPADGGIHWQGSESASITLREGKLRNVPTVQAGAIRLRLLDKVFGQPAEKGEFMLQIAAEPNLGWRKATALRIDKAVDDQGQQWQLSLFALNSPKIAMDVAIRTPDIAPACGSLMPLVLTPGEKPVKSLKELKGVITAEVLSRPKTILTVDDVLKSDGKTFTLPDKGILKIITSHSLPEGVTYSGPEKAKDRKDWVSIMVEFLDMPTASDDQSRFDLTLLRVEDDAGKQPLLARCPSFVPHGSENGALLYYGPLPKGQKSLQLVVSRRRSITVTIPFTFKDVPLP